MASFDIITSTRKAYQTSWQERGYLVRLAAFPFILQIVCMIFSSASSDGEDYFRNGLIMIPAMLAQGWMAAHYARLIVLGHRWPFRPTGQVDADLAALHMRARGVLAGMIVYTLIAMAVHLCKVTALMIFQPYLPVDGATPPAVPPQIHLLSWMMLIGLVWGVRLAWLYIPYALNLTGQSYFKAVGGWSVSIYMVGAWLICFMPFVLCYSVASKLIMAGGPNGIAYLLILLINAGLEIVYTLLITAAMTYGLRELYSKVEKAGS